MVRDLVWGGSVAVEFHLSPTDTTSLRPPRPFFRQLPRMAYLPLYLPELVQYFSSTTLGWGQEHMWMECNDQPLRWHLPVGVLYDTVMERAYDTRPGKTCESTEAQVKPWEIVVHFQSFPVDSILRCNDEPAMERLYIHSLKQAQYLLYGSLRVFNELQSNKQTQLWQAVKSASQTGVDQVLAVLKSNDHIRHIPVRCIMANGGSRQLPIKPMQSSSTQFIESPTSATSPGAQPEEQPSESTDVPESAESAEATEPAEDTNPTEATEATEATETADEQTVESKQEVVEIIPDPVETSQPTTLLDAYRALIPHVLETNEQNEECVSSDYDILIQGIRVPPHAPLLEVWQELRYADMYLYICVVKQ